MLGLSGSPGHRSTRLSGELSTQPEGEVRLGEAGLETKALAIPDTTTTRPSLARVIGMAILASAPEVATAHRPIKVTR